MMAESAPQPHPSRDSLRMVLSGFTRAAACALLTVALAQPAAAEQDRTIMLLVGSTGGWNSNIFLAPDNTQSVYYAAPYVTLSLDKTYAQQEIQANVTQTFYRYSISSLDASAFSYTGTWLWHMTPSWTGTISGGSSKSVNNFNQFQNTNDQSFIVTTYNGNINLDGIIFGGWHVLAGGSFLQSTNSQQFQAQGNFREYGVSDTGIKYVAESGSSIAAINRWNQGVYFNNAIGAITLPDNNFQEQENGLKSTWNLSGKSTLDSRLTWLERRYERFSQRNFSGPTGEINYNWASSGKLQLNFTAARVLAAYLTAQSSYTVTYTQSFSPVWQATEKTALHLHFEHSTIAYRGPVIPIPPPFPLRGDTVLSARLGVDWTPLRNAALGASVERSHRSSNIFADEYNDILVTINASLKF